MSSCQNDNAYHVNKYTQRTEKENVASKSQIATPAPPCVGLLGLPPELRLMIYDSVMNTDIQHHLPRLNYKYSSRQSPPRLPLRDLARVCKLLAREIRGHLHSLPTSERYASISIRADSKGRTAYLFRAPCPAEELLAVRFVYEIFSTKSLRLRFNLSTDIEEYERRVLFESTVHDFLTTVELQVFCHIKPDETDPPDEDRYNDDVDHNRSTLKSWCESGFYAPNEPHLKGSTVDSWKPSAIDTRGQQNMNGNRQGRGRRGLGRLWRLVKRAYRSLSDAF